jgi:hypothetical protein
MRHLGAIVFVRPTSDSIQFLIDELRNPKYGKYELFFTNTIKKSALERLAESDDHEVVTKIQEVFADYYVINTDLFSVNLPSTTIYGSNGPDFWAADSLNRSVEALSAVLLSLKRRPLIRYDRNSAMAKKLGTEIQYTIKQEKTLFDFNNAALDTPPILLILDRRNDPVTPLLTPWTYQAMVHELLGIHNNRVDLSNVPDIQKELKEIVLSGDQDAFFRKSMYLNFGDLGATIKDYVNQYQSKIKSNQNIESISDMKRFVEDYPEFRKLSGNVSKHVSLVGELSRLVSTQQLLEVSQLEQSLACDDSHNSDLKAIQETLQFPIDDDIKVRLVALYGLRYQHHSNYSLSPLLSLLEHTTTISKSRIGTIKRLVDTYGGSSFRQENIYQTESFFSRAQSGFKGLKGAENVYTQHEPLLERTITSLLKGKLKKATHPFLAPAADDAGAPPLPAWARGTDGDTDRPQDIIVFIVGGVTFEESRLIAAINSSTPSVRIVLGGTSVLNSREFLDSLEANGTKWPEPGVAGRLAARVRP